MAWSAGGNISAATSSLTATGTLTSGLRMGGFVAGANVTTCQEYDGTSWSAGGAITTATRALGRAGTQTDAIICAGFTTTYVTTTEEYNGTSWSSGGALSTARYQLASNGSASTEAWAAGGSNAGGALDSTEEYNGTSWSAGGTLGTAGRENGCGVTTAGLALGSGDSAANGTTEEYNGTSWSAGGNKTAKRLCASTGSQTSAGSCGGYDSIDTATDTCEKYDGTTWTSWDTMSSVRRSFAAFGESINAAVVVGGFNLVGTSLDSSEENVTASGPAGVKTWDAITQSTGISTYFGTALASTKTVIGVS